MLGMPRVVNADPAPFTPLFSKHSEDADIREVTEGGTEELGQPGSPCLCLNPQASYSYCLSCMGFSEDV